MGFVVNHVGLCVTDAERSRRFYEAVLGFDFWHALDVPDDMAAKLLDLTPPLGSTAVYLRRDEFVLELIVYADTEVVEPARPRVMNELGLTHLSVAVDDIDATAAKAVEYGGSVLDQTHVGAAVMIRDPDGQLLELLPMGYRERLPS
jgi:lactoylglutathione lyase